MLIPHSSLLFCARVWLTTSRFIINFLWLMTSQFIKVTFFFLCYIHLWLIDCFSNEIDGKICNTDKLKWILLSILFSVYICFDFSLAFIDTWREKSFELGVLLVLFKKTNWQPYLKKYFRHQSFLFFFLICKKIRINLFNKFSILIFWFLLFLIHAIKPIRHFDKYP